MGMFDMVTADCPECGEKDAIEYQSKASACMMENFPIDKVPICIAIDIEHYSERCFKCKTEFELSTDIHIPEYVKFTLLKKEK